MQALGIGSGKSRRLEPIRGRGFAPRKAAKRTPRRDVEATAVSKRSGPRQALPPRGAVEGDPTTGARYCSGFGVSAPLTSGPPRPVSELVPDVLRMPPDDW